MRGKPCFTEHQLEFAREKQGGNAAVLITALFSFCPIIDPAWRVRAVRHLKRGFMSVFHWIEKIPIRMEDASQRDQQKLQDIKPKTERGNTILFLCNHNKTTKTL
jgi:hypothetical protein